MFEKRLHEIDERKLEIRKELESDSKELELDALEEELRGLEEEKAQIEKRRKIAEGIGVDKVQARKIDGIKQADEQPEVRNLENIAAAPEYRSAFLKALQGKPLNEVEKRYTSASDSAGAVIPTETGSKIFDSMTKIAPMLNEIELLRVPGNLRFAVQGTRNAAAAHDENADITPAADTLTTVTLAGYEFVKVLRISATVQAMGIDEFENWLTRTLGEDIAVAIDNEIINGTTVTGNITTAQTWVADTNSIEYTNGGKVGYGDLTDAIALLPSTFDPNAKFLMSKATFYQHVMQVVDGNGNLIAIQDFATPGRYRILGYEVLIDDNVTDGDIYLGDYKQVVGNLAGDVRIDRSEASGFLNNAIDYRATAIFDCDVAQPDAIIKITEASGT